MIKPTTNLGRYNLSQIGGFLEEIDAYPYSKFERLSSLYRQFRSIDYFLFVLIIIIEETGLQGS